jgi:hypothetical protein
MLTHRLILHSKRYPTESRGTAWWSSSIACHTPLSEPDFLCNWLVLLPIFALALSCIKMTQRWISQPFLISPQSCSLKHVLVLPDLLCVSSVEMTLFSVDFLSPEEILCKKVQTRVRGKVSWFKSSHQLSKFFTGQLICSMATLSWADEADSMTVRIPPGRAPLSANPRVSVRWKRRCNCTLSGSRSSSPEDRFNRDGLHGKQIKFNAALSSGKCFK